MLDELSLKNLASILAKGPILSVYLDVDPTRRTAEEYKLHLRDLLKQANSAADERDIEAVRRYVELEYDWSGRGLAMFSRQAENLWHAYPLALPVNSDVKVGYRPFISPWVELSGRYGRYGVALVDRQGARFFLFAMGALVFQDGVVGEDVRHTRKGRGSSVVGMRGGSPLSGRKETELVLRNLKDIAANLASFVQEHHLRWLLLAGSEETVVKFREVLPPALQALVVGSFVADMSTNETEMRDLSQAILEHVAEHHHQQIINTVVTATAKGQNGVLGLDATLSMVQEGRVQALIVEREYHQAGYRCTGCNYLTAQRMERCLFCGGQFEETRDAVEAVINQVVASGVDVVIVPNHTVAEARIGALLRY